MFPKAKRVLHDEVLDRIGVDLERAHTARISVAPATPDRNRPRRLRSRLDPRERTLADRRALQ
jgi:hypothetical protein